LGAGSLRAALAAADILPGKDTIRFHLSVAPAGTENTIALTSGALFSTGNVAIDGPGAGTLIVDGGGARGIFDFSDGNTAADSPVSISGVSIIDGNTGSAFGGGVYSTESLTLSRVVISGCAAASGGGVFVEGTKGAAFVSVSNSLIAEDMTTGSGGGLNLHKVRSIAVKNSTISGNSASVLGGGMSLVLNAAGTGISVTGCTVTRNVGEIGGGLFASDGSSLPTAKTIISGCTVSENASYSNDGAGGGMSLEQGNVSVSGTTIIGNSSVYYGGGISAGGFTSLTISKSTIRGNHTAKPNTTNEGGGGGVSIVGPGTGTLVPVTVIGCTLVDNSGNLGGGLLAQNGVKLTVTGSIFSSDAAASGGGLMTQGTGANHVDVSVTGTTFADDNGSGAHFSGSGTVAVTSSKITGCFAAEGGGIAVYGDSTDTFSLKNTVISGNTALSSGGGLFVSQTSSATVAGGSISNNVAGFEGGGAYFAGSVGTVIGTTMSGNVAGFAGGGAYNASAGGMTIQIVKVWGNSAPSHADTGGVFTFA
jgi:hypothetical protein